MRTRTKIIGAVAALGLATGLVSCSSGDPSSTGSDTISYWLWDSAQQPGYQQCADAFQQENPGLKVRITQYGWSDYWAKITAGFIAGTGPDVFTDHLSKFADFVDLGVLEPLNDLDATASIDPDQYQDGLSELWVGQDGKQYGSPKDWDTVAFFANKQMLADAGISLQDLNTATWNPEDGGTFEKIIAHLSIDKNGVRGDEPGFDPKHVAVYGMSQSGGGGNLGQTQWSSFAFSTGWEYANKNPWGTKTNFDDPRFIKTVEWYQGLIAKGFTPDQATTANGNFGANQQFASKRSALSQDGSWMISTYTDFKDIDVAIAPTPIGPSGERASMFNGLADSINAQSPRKEQAAKWVAFMSGRTCQDLIAKAGVVFPAQKASTELSVQARLAKGVDVSGFTVQVTDKTTHLAPVTKRPNRVGLAMAPVMEAIMIGKVKPAPALTELNEKVNSILTRGY
ncbi:ABC transporter substrate-binding protein [Plantibacter sp. Mn2098]|uniref:ABC transporter substrate-binding protein n=1 Tax=Plantibacter sp. Mn2098 TaxID=3395266 RepID=UPI003BD4F3A1